MLGFHYKNKTLFCESVNLEKIVSKFGTPLYIYNELHISENVLKLKKHLPKNCDIYFAVKSNSNIHILKLLKKLGTGVDIVSGGELFRAKKSGFKGNQVVFSGVGKTTEEIIEAIRFNIKSFNIESIPELELINELAHQYKKKANVLLRVNPNISAKTHPHISTGLRQNKFGLLNEELKEILARKDTFKNIIFEGLSCHIGSQIQSLRPLKDAFIYLKNLAHTMPFKVNTLDLGGGLGISYDGTTAVSLIEYSKLISKIFKNEPYRICIEPGRSIVGAAGVLATQCLFIKKRKNKNILVVDAGMNDLIRPALYNAYHECIPLTLHTESILKTDIVGPVCESSDVFTTSKSLSFDANSKYLVFLNAGAYGMSMSSQYNSRPRPCEVLICNSKVRQIRKRETYEDLIKNENI